MDKQNKQLAYAVLKWLEKHKNTDEGLDVALQCISESFAVRLNSDDQKLYDIGLDLEDIFRDAAAKHGEAATQDEKLQEFINILQSKGYFNGVEEGSPPIQNGTKDTRKQNKNSKLGITPSRV